MEVVWAPDRILHFVTTPLVGEVTPPDAAKLGLSRAPRANVQGPPMQPTPSCEALPRLLPMVTVASAAAGASSSDEQIAADVIALRGALITEPEYPQ